MTKLNCTILPDNSASHTDSNTDSNRKAAGARLGQIVQRDLSKKEKSTSANRDPHLELSLAGKELGLEGLKLVCGKSSHLPRGQR
jgi:hypothetical protein